jgi:predicted phage terminase large subunit-like protein
MQSKPPLPSLIQIERELGKRHLRDFIEIAWSQSIEPGTVYVPGYHIDAICDHLEAVFSGDIRRMVINIPPRHMKSLSVCVAFPAWGWILRPEFKWLFTSYGFHLVTRDAAKTRNLINSNWYQERWGDVYQITKSTEDRYFTDAGGHRISASTTGKGTGDGGDIVVADDPHNTLEAESAIIRQKTITWWTETMATRLNDLKTGRRVIIMQRQHQSDLSGHVLAAGGYEHLCLPAEFEPSRLVPHKVDPEGNETPNLEYTPPTSLGFSDWRTKEGELLWPAKNGPEEIDQLKTDMGTYAVAGQLQQRPAPRGGGMFKREWFEIVDIKPAMARRVRYWDCASTKPKPGTSQDPDYTVGALVSRTPDGIIIIEDIQRMRDTSMAVEQRAKQTAELDGLKVGIYREQEPGAAGKDIISHWLRHVLNGFPFKGHRPTGPKEERAGPLAAQAEGGNVKLLRGRWNEAFLAELEHFPTGSHDDQVDAVSGAYMILATGVVPKIRRIA